MRIDKILTHDIEFIDSPVLIRQIAHKNHYNFQTLHRHNYFEVMFFRNGGGENLIDLQKYDVRDNGCYIIYPGQTHLLNRNPESAGVLIQFKLESISSQKLARILQERAWSGQGAVIFEQNQTAMAGMVSFVEAMQNGAQSKSTYWKESQKSLLQALLFELCAFGTDDKSESLNTDFYHFQKLVDRHFKTAHSVRFYVSKLPVSEKRLSTLCKAYCGLTPLQVIHKRLLLEAKRSLLIGDQAHKEIAFDLGFDSPASFSAFIKKKTGKTASQVQSQMTEIHK